MGCCENWILLGNLTFCGFILLILLDIFLELWQFNLLRVAKGRVVQGRGRREKTEGKLRPAKQSMRKKRQTGLRKEDTSHQGFFDQNRMLEVMDGSGEWRSPDAIFQYPLFALVKLERPTECCISGDNELGRPSF